MGPVLLKESQDCPDCFVKTWLAILFEPKIYTNNVWLNCVNSGPDFQIFFCCLMVRISFLFRGEMSFVLLVYHLCLKSNIGALNKNPWKEAYFSNKRTFHRRCHVCIYIYIHTYIYAAGSISCPHLPLCWVNKWSSFTPPPNKKQQNNKITFHQTPGVESFLSKERFKNPYLKQTFWVNKWSIFAFENLSQDADHLLTLAWTTFWPSFLHTPKKQCPKWTETTISEWSWRKLHTNLKNRKTKNYHFHIWKHNCPLWFSPEVVPLFGAPLCIVLFFFSLPLAYLTT